MATDCCWTNNSNGDLLQYDFLNPGDWSSERVAAEQSAIAALLESPHSDAREPAPAWLMLARRLPAPLLAALVAELRAGNQLAGIGSQGWPNDGSIVVTMRERFAAARQALPPGVAWRQPNDPHYAREELSQKVGAVEFLIIT
ncbi:MAG: hypothetical protein ABWY02_04395 [Telluria sp.]